jgi:hypothetical protein
MKIATHSIDADLTRIQRQDNKRTLRAKARKADRHTRYVRTLNVQRHTTNPTETR